MEKNRQDSQNDKKTKTTQTGKLTWDLDQKMKTSPTILNSSSASGSGQVSHLALQTESAVIKID